MGAQPRMRPQWWRSRVHWLWIPASVLLTLGATTAWRQRFQYLSRDQVAVKGEAELLVYAKSGQRVLLLDRFNRDVSVGDELRFVLTGVPEGSAYLMLASVDEQAHTTIYYPYQGARSAALPGPGRWEVPGSIVLDDTPGVERVFALFSKRPLAAAEVHDALAALGKQGKNAIRDTHEIAVGAATLRSFLLFKKPRQNADLSQ